MNIALRVLFVGSLLLSFRAFGEESLKAQLEAKADQSTLPQEIKDQMARHRDEVEATGIYDKAKKVGDLAPDFTLKDYRGQTVNLAALLENGPVVLTWYRGGW
ncbi:MAG: hypothetical protein AAGA96_04005 [Verrucomicrobiota bacterium]